MKPGKHSGNFLFSPKIKSGSGMDDGEINPLSGGSPYSCSRSKAERRRQKEKGFRGSSWGNIKDKGRGSTIRAEQQTRRGVPPEA